MTSSISTRYPRLRPVDVRPIVHSGKSYVLLRDPLQLSDKTLLIPQLLAAVLALCDGTRADAGDLCAAFALRSGLQLDRSMIENLLSALDEALLLDNDRFVEAQQQVLAEYRNAEFRTPLLAGPSYPADPDDLRALLTHFVVSSPQSDSLPDRSPERSGLVSPHIDYARGGPVYAQVWKRSEEIARNAELVVLLGTDHYGAEQQFTLTRQNYATPLGVLPTARDVVDSLAEVIGPDRAFAGELRHRGEHSIELAAVWLQHSREGVECEMVPVLCGSFRELILGSSAADASAEIEDVVATLRRAIAGRRTMVVAAGDLSHVGPAFGGPPVDLAGRAKLKESDDKLIDRICAGDAEGFLAKIIETQDRTNVCGVSPIYIALRLLEGASGERFGYDRCPADEEGTSLVSVCGVVFD